MLLKEMFSPIGAPKQDQQDIDWLGDLKFFIDNDDAIEKCLGHYCEKFEVETPEEKFPKEKLIELAKRCAEEQEKYLDKGDYET
jgi:hypothetical protein